MFKTVDLTRLNTEAAGNKFSNAAVSVRDAAGRSGYLVPAGSGRKQISPLGEDVVAALPNQEAVKAAVASQQGRRRRKARKNKTKKG